MTVFLFLFKVSFFNSRKYTKRINKKETKGWIENKKYCILCGSLLEKGRSIISDEYKGEKESIVHLFGCPECYGGRAGLERRCPVCGKGLSEKGYIKGKMWMEGDKRRVHISGCTECLKITAGG